MYKLIEEIRKEEKREVVIRMLENDEICVDMMALYSGLSRIEVENIIKGNNNITNLIRRICRCNTKIYR